MIRRWKFALSLLGWLIAAAAPAAAYEVELRYFRVEDPALADDLARTADDFEAREKPLREQRRRAAYNSPDYARVQDALRALQIERDREFLRLLADTPPEVRFATSARTDQLVRESGDVNGKPLNVQVRLGREEDGLVTLEVQADYDGAALYQGEALQVPLATPHLVSRAFVKMGGDRRGSMVFITVAP